MKHRGLEKHKHCIIRGPRSSESWRNNIVHSHEGGDKPHTHPDTGPGAYTIDKDDWYATTGLRGGGRKTFTKVPSGEQLGEVIPYDGSFRVIICDPPCPPGHRGNGPGEALPLRIAKTFKSGFTVHALPPRGGAR